MATERLTKAQREALELLGEYVHDGGWARCWTDATERDWLTDQLFVNHSTAQSLARRGLAELASCGELNRGLLSRGTDIRITGAGRRALHGE